MLHTLDPESMPYEVTFLVLLLDHHWQNHRTYGYCVQRLHEVDRRRLKPALLPRASGAEEPA